MKKNLIPELSRCRRAAGGAYKSIEDVVKKTKNTRLRAHLFNTTVLPALIHTSETWAFRKHEEKAVSLIESAIDALQESRRPVDQISSPSPSKKIMMLFVSHAKGGITGRLWHAIGTNGRITGEALSYVYLVRSVDIENDFKEELNRRMRAK
ncbi:hypothetical protein RB195_025227 [Necator americanus]|uniref:Uncharacterized protein n=1 Tax=Necator americanus TaxID=51031 RepID=A0ABR1ERC8_NECAM